MYLKRSITVNWGNLPSQELEYGPINLFSGGNGSGKTTAADALQTLMTAAHDNLFTYNPGQDETTQRGRGGKQVRTLASYILGCDDGAFARPWDVDGYIAGVFHPTNGESAESFTAVIGVRAHLDRAGNTAQARQDDLLLMIVSGEMLNRLRNNVLLEKQEKLAGLRDTFNTTFVSDLCHEIRQAVNDGGLIASW
jgi:energy-coupling factor transporter ATP-binding protein EcfA2